MRPLHLGIEKIALMASQIKLNTALQTHSEVAPSEPQCKTPISYALEHEEELKITRSLAQPSFEEIFPKCVTLGKTKHKFTLLLDLDETLIWSQHSALTAHEDEYTIAKRPYLMEFLQRMDPIFEIVIFTAACEDYAELAVNCFDPERKLIKTIISKRSCIETKEGYWVKDLRIIADRELSKMLIVDNIIFSYSFQLENGIPITSYEGEDDDKELEYLALYLEGLAQTEDMVASNRAYVGL